MIRGIRGVRNSFCAQNAKGLLAESIDARAAWGWATRLLDAGNGKGGEGGG